MRRVEVSAESQNSRPLSPALHISRQTVNACRCIEKVRAGRLLPCLRYLSIRLQECRSVSRTRRDCSPLPPALQLPSTRLLAVHRLPSASLSVCSVQPPQAGMPGRTDRRACRSARSPILRDFARARGKRRAARKIGLGLQQYTSRQFWTLHYPLYLMQRFDEHRRLLFVCHRCDVHVCCFHCSRLRF